MSFETSGIAALKSWKTYDDKAMLFPEGEDEEHKALARSKIPKALAHLEGFFSKVQADTLPDHRPGYDVVLELHGETLTTGPPSYRTPVKYLPLEKEVTDKLLKIGFIEASKEKDAPPILFVPKPRLKEKRLCVDYRWRNKYLRDRRQVARHEWKQMPHALAVN